MVRVLLVDDEPFIVQGLKVMLEGQSVNCEVVGEASNGKEALEFLKQREVDLVFADIKMPVMTGLELLETIRTEKISDAYFVILSGYSDFQYAQQALRYDCMDYVLKPVKHEELERILEQVEKLNREKEEQEEKEQHWEQAVFFEEYPYGTVRRNGQRCFTISERQSSVFRSIPLCGDRGRSS